MAPPPDSAAGVRSPCWRRAIHRTKGRASATSAPGPAANRYQDRQAVSRFSSQAGTQARPIVLLHQPQGDGLSPISPSPPLPAIGTGRPLSTYSLPIPRALKARHRRGLVCADRPDLGAAPGFVPWTAGGALAIVARWPQIGLPGPGAATLAEARGVVSPRTSALRERFRELRGIAPARELTRLRKAAGRWLRPRERSTPPTGLRMAFTLRRGPRQRDDDHRDILHLLREVEERGRHP